MEFLDEEDTIHKADNHRIPFCELLFLVSVFVGLSQEVKVHRDQTETLTPILPPRDRVFLDVKSPASLSGNVVLLYEFTPVTPVKK